MHNFHETFQHYSNIELLKIVMRPHDYQPEAFNAAMQIIDSRNVTDEERNEVTAFYADIEQRHIEKQQQIEKITNKINDFIQPLTQPGGDIKPGKWINIFLLVIGIQYLYTIYSAGKALYLLYQYPVGGFDYEIIPFLFSLVYIPVIFYTIYKRNRWGWILIFADNTIAGVFLIGQLYMMIRFREDMNYNSGNYIVSVLLRAVFFSFLWRNDIAAYFNVTEEQKKFYSLRVLMVALGLVAGLSAFFIFIMK